MTRYPSRSQLANKVMDEIGIPDDLETSMLKLLNDSFGDELIDIHKYYSLSNEITDAKILIRLARAMLFRIIDELVEKDD